MNAVYIYPEDIGVSDQWAAKWYNFCKKLGYTENNIPSCVLIVEIKTPY